MWNPFRSREGDLDRELRFHIEEQEKDYELEGMSRKEAHRRTLRDFGSLAHIREACRDVDPVGGVLSLTTDARLAFRRLLKRPATSAASVLALACAIGAAAAGWSLVSAVTLDPLPAVDTQGLVVVDRPPRRDPGYLIQSMPRSYTDLRWLDGAGVFEQLTAGSGRTVPVLVMEAAAAPIEAERYLVGPGFFETLGVQLALGRPFLDEESGRAERAVILSYAFWRGRFGGDPDVLGRQIVIDGEPAVVVGVAPRRFEGINVGSRPDLYLPLDYRDRDDDSGWLTVVGRLPRESRPEAVAAFLDDLAPDPEWRWDLVDIEVAALPLTSREGISRFADLFGGTTGLLLVIGCLAVSTLLLVRTEDRRAEFSMCLALGPLVCGWPGASLWRACCWGLVAPRSPCRSHTGSSRPPVDSNFRAACPSRFSSCPWTRPCFWQ
jgi:hypothetical protein